jgi:hypothetical protein
LVTFTYTPDLFLFSWVIWVDLLAVLFTRIRKRTLSRAFLTLPRVVGTYLPILPFIIMCPQRCVEFSQVAFISVLIAALVCSHVTLDIFEILFFYKIE